MKQRHTIICLAIAAAAWSAVARGADPAQDLEDQYQTALAVLRKPTATGVLITEVAPESVAAAAMVQSQTASRGLRAGDIITEYYGRKVATLDDLTAQIAEAMARRLADNTAGSNVIVRFRRGRDELTALLPREVLGIRAVEVQNGVPGPRNVPPNARGTLALDWKTVLQTIRDDNAAADTGPAIPGAKPAITAAFRLFEHTDAAPDPAHPGAMLRFADEQWSGWQLCTLSTQGDGVLSGTCNMYHLIPGGRSGEDGVLPTEHSAFSFALRLGDYTTAPAFVLEQTSTRDAAAKGQENMQAVSVAARLGEKLQITAGLTPLEMQLGDGGGHVERHDNAAPLDAAPACALPWIAAALPHEADAGLALHLLSARDLLPRPGYVLVARGRVAMPAETADAAPAATRPTTTPASTSASAPAAPWRVDLMHFGVVIESYWFSDQRRLLGVQTQGPTSIIARRADSAASATRPMEQKKQDP